MPILVILSSFAFILFFNAKGIFLGGMVTAELKDQQLNVLCSKFQFYQNSLDIFKGILVDLYLC